MLLGIMGKPIAHERPRRRSPMSWRVNFIHRYQLTAQAIHRLRDDERRANRGVAQLVTEGLKEQWYQHTRLEAGRDSEEDGPAFTPSP